MSWESFGPEVLALPWFDSASADSVRGLIDAAPQVSMVVLYQPDMDEATQLREAAVMLDLLAHDEADGLVIGARPTDALKVVEGGLVVGSVDRAELIELSPPAVVKAEALRGALSGSSPEEGCLTSLLARGGRLRWRSSFSSSAGSA
ncbi:MAG TPA: hypothetical protein VID03_01050 [Acidimicrobiia bacterium]